VTEHRSATKGFYDKLQLDENSEAREFLESLLADPTRTYEEICQRSKSSGLFENLKIPTPQDLTRYRQRKARDENRQTVLRLIGDTLAQDDAGTLLNAAVKNPSGVAAKAIRKILADNVLARFDAEVEGVDVVNLSREAARHALVEQRDRKLDLDEDKIALERKRLEIQEKQQELAKDKFNVAAKTWQFILSWIVKRQPTFADLMTKESDALLTDLEAYIESGDV
jgi:hypothetical protein